MGEGEAKNLEKKGRDKTLHNDKNNVNDTLLKAFLCDTKSINEN